MKCAVCSKEWPDPQCRKIDLSDLEKRYVAESGRTDVPDSYHYCPPCWRIISDRSLGAQYIKGVLQVQLRAKGFVDADKMAQGLMDKLLSLTKRN